MFTFSSNYSIISFPIVHEKLFWQQVGNWAWGIGQNSSEFRVPSSEFRVPSKEVRFPTQHSQLSTDQGHWALGIGHWALGIGKNTVRVNLTRNGRLETASTQTKPTDLG
ncbi:hypothetical protein [Nostoc sp.]|uniref:hypothetical protein n=1 Tax=Nostoc sp. TaxID=1180 RepID=UPI002FFB66D9